MHFDGLTGVEGAEVGNGELVGHIAHDCRAHTRIHARDNVEEASAVLRVNLD